MFPWLFENAVVAAALAGAVGLVCRVARPRPAVCHALWLLVLLKLLAPPLLRWPWPLAPPWQPPEAAVAPTEERLAPVTVAEELPFFAAEEVIGPVDSPVLAVVPEVEEEARDALSPDTTGEFAPALVDFWLAGILGMAIIQIVRLVRFRRRASRSAAAPEWLNDEVSELAAQVGVRPPTVRVLMGLPSPVVWSLGRPELLWPAELLVSLSDAGRRAATVHELAHLRRRDHWVGWLQLVASCLWWWNPVFWHVRRQIGRTAELACDAWVVATLPDARRAYAEALLEVCELQSRQTAPALALSMSGTRQDLERRLVMIMRESVPARLPYRALGGILLLALIVFPVWSQSTPAIAPAAEPSGAGVARTTAQAPAPVAENEQRLQRLEAALQELLKEVKDLRSEKTRTLATKSTAVTRPVPAAAAPTLARWYEGTPTTNLARSIYAADPSTSLAISLSRVTYKLPKEKAEALGKLLDLQPKQTVLEYKVEGEGLVVTTTPDAQRIVGEFVDLLQGKVRPGSARLDFRSYTPALPPVAAPANPKK